jgi:tRNA A37 threonylcarbamoyladenosine dehydratase
MTVNPAFQRLSLLAGTEMTDHLSRVHVMIFGVGGVGSWCAEALARSAVGRLTIVDSDVVCVTNINRQVEATTATVGEFKVDALKRRLLEINPLCEVRALGRVFTGERAGDFTIEGADYVIDAIDSLTHKLDLIEYCARAGVTLYSSMGMARKLDPTRIRTADIWHTQGCPLARLVRAELRKRGFTGHFTAVYSGEQLPLQTGVEISCGSGTCLCPARDRALLKERALLEESSNPAAPVEWCSSKKVINGSAVTVTATAGMILASLVLQDLYGKCAGDSDAAGARADSAAIDDSIAVDTVEAALHG